MRGGVLRISERRLHLPKNLTFQNGIIFLDRQTDRHCGEVTFPKTIQTYDFWRKKDKKYYYVLEFSG